MDLAILLEALDKIPNKNRPQVGSGVAPEEIQIPTIRIGMAKKTTSNPHTHVFHLEMMMLWTLLSSAKPQQKKRRRNIATWVDTSTVESKAILRTTVPANPPALVLSK